MAPVTGPVREELGVSTSQSPDETLKRLGRLQQQETGAVVNWCGTYEDVAQRLLRRWELELQWNQ